MDPLSGRQRRQNLHFRVVCGRCSGTFTAADESSELTGSPGFQTDGIVMCQWRVVFVTVLSLLTGRSAVAG